MNDKGARDLKKTRNITKQRMHSYIYVGKETEIIMITLNGVCAF
jgi:hypothetical protein